MLPLVTCVSHSSDSCIAWGLQSSADPLPIEEGDLRRVSIPELPMRSIPSHKTPQLAYAAAIPGISILQPARLCCMALPFRFDCQL